MKQIRVKQQEKEMWNMYSTMPVQSCKLTAVHCNPKHWDRQAWANNVYTNQTPRSQGPRCLPLIQHYSYDVPIFRANTIGIKHGLSCINIRQVPREVSKPEAGMLMHWKTMFDRYYCIKTENICYISRYFLHYFVSPFYRYLERNFHGLCSF